MHPETQTSLPRDRNAPAPEHSPQAAAEMLARYRQLRDSGVEAADQGRFAEAEPLFTEARELARRIGDPAMEDLAFCNWASVRIAVDGSPEVLAPLREILVRSPDPVTCRLAAYHISRIYERQGETRKGLFYARVARDRTAQIESPDPSWVAANHNQIANFLVAQSEFHRAIEEYRLAIAAQPEGGTYRSHLLRQNMGYCHLMLGDLGKAFTLLLGALRAYRRLRATSLLATNHLDLAYAYLEIGRTRYAVHHAERALALARQKGDESTIKNALYLMGEACHQDGDDESARVHFTELSDRYGNLPFIADFLLSVDVRHMINLRA